MYALIALGYTMVYGIINLINFAHGEVMMVGALTSWTVIGLLRPAHPDWPGYVILLIALSSLASWPRYLTSSSKKLLTALCVTAQSWRP